MLAQVLTVRLVQTQEHSWRRNLVLFLVDSCISARQWTDICNHRRKLVKISGRAWGARIIGGGRDQWLGGTSHSVRRASPSWNNRRAGAPSAGLRLPWFCVCTSLTVMTWTSISWCWVSVTNVFLTFTQVMLSVMLSIVFHWLYIHYSILFLVNLTS